MKEDEGAEDGAGEEKAEAEEEEEEEGASTALRNSIVYEVLLVTNSPQTSLRCSLLLARAAR